MGDHSKRKRVVVTGMGIVSSLGCSADAFWQAICDGRDGIGRITVCDLSDFNYQQGGQVAEIPEVIDFPDLSEDRAIRLLLPAVHEAWTQAGLADGDDTAVVLATNFSSIGTAEDDLGTDHCQMNGDLGFDTAVNLVASHWGCAAAGMSLSLSCSSGTAAIGYGTELIRNGRAKSVIAGGFDAISRFAWAGLSVLRTMTMDKIRPFDLNRAGTLFSEGAGVVILEDLESARKRNASIFAEVAGFGFNNNAFHMTTPAKDGKGLAEAMRMALDDARIDPAKVDHINTHGTGTKLNDVTESQAIKSVLGDRAREIVITSVKSMTGHLMGAAGSIEAIATVRSLTTDLVPPTINFETPDAECDLQFPHGEAIALPIRAAISNSSGIGGNNACLVFTEVEEVNS